VTDTFTPADVQQTPWWRSGKIVVVGIFAGLLVGGYFYIQTVPPAWLRAFGAEIATRAAADPNPPQIEDAREASPRMPVDNPRICFARVVRTPWDRVVFVTYDQGKTLAEHPTLSKATWDARDAAQRQLIADDRYQLIVLLKDNTVIDSQLFYTFWADLSGLARTDGFLPDDAIFQSQSLAGRYVLAPVPNAKLEDCPK